MTLDSLWTQDSMTTTGYISVYDFLHDQYAYFGNQGDIEVGHNFNNEGIFYNNGTLSVDNDASNCNIQQSDAILTNNGVLCVINNFSNCAGDTLQGTGEVYISGSSSNFGRVQGTLQINTPTSGFTTNTGTIGGMVTFGNTTCNLGESIEAFEPVFVYPNPAKDMLNISVKNVNYQILDFSGRIIKSGSTPNGEIYVDDLKSGSYLILINGKQIGSAKHTFIKL